MTLRQFPNAFQTPPSVCNAKARDDNNAVPRFYLSRWRLFGNALSAALRWGLAALSGRSRRGFELIEFLQRGCGLRRSSLVGLRRRNNELNELTNCRAARVRGIAPERGSYSRIGARPYLPPVLIDSRCCPCKVECSKFRKISVRFFAKQQVAKHAHMINEQSAKRSALKGQSVCSAGQRPGYQCINAYAL